MPNRYEKPARPPTLALLEGYLIDARPALSQWLADPDATETRRVDAVAALLTLARAALRLADEWANMTHGWRASPERGTRYGAMPLELRHFLTVEGLRILTADDPVAALRRLLGQKHRGRGRPFMDNEYRDLTITEDVQIRVDAGSSIADACCVVAKAAHLSPETVRNIYFARRNDPAVRAAIDFRAFWKLEGDADADKPGAPNSG
jgi:hypothetical protein